MVKRNSEFDMRIAAIREAALFARAARASTGLSQKSFAKQAGIASGTISNIETANCPTPPSLVTLIKIAKSAGKNIKITFDN